MAVTRAKTPTWSRALIFEIFLKEEKKRKEKKEGRKKKSQ
jgi:hypothetical protein